MAKVVFLETREVKDHRGVVVERFEAGKIYDLNPASAKWWILQRCAAAVPDPPRAATAPESATPAPAAATARQSGGRGKRPTAVATEGTGEDGGFAS